MPRRPRPARSILIGAVLLVAVGGACGSNESPTPTGPATLAPSATPAGGTASPATSGGPGASSSPGTTAAPSVGQTETDTDIGTIWDALPPGFPAYPGSTPTETGEGPVSGQFAVPADVATVATFLQAGMEGAGFSTDALSGPFEDGSMTLESSNPEFGDCRVRTTIAPAGGTTLVTVLYGSACPMG